MKPAIESLLEPAQGYFDLGLFHDAWEALDELEPTVRAHPKTLSLRLDILYALGRWEDAAALGAGCCRNWSNYEDFFVKTSSALIRLKDHKNARELLLGAPERMRSLPDYHYILARCEARLGLIREAKASLAECFDRDKSYRQRALDEPDLESVWESLPKEK